MKFVHIADMHFDAPFTSLSAKENLGDVRRLEQRKVFKKIIEYIKDNNIEYFFIAGDLYEHEYVKKSTVEFIISCFKEIPNTKIFITPGNHDPYLNNSFYNTYNFGENVYIFKGNIEKYEDANVVIYGMGFTEFYMNNSPLESLTIEQKKKPNILITHCDLNGNKDSEGLSYNPILGSKLNSLGFDYVAMGHIHRNNIRNNNTRLFYPGSTISLGFDELGEHGMIVGEVTKRSFNLNFVKLDERIFTKIGVNVESFYSKEDLIEYILDINLNEKNLYKVILTGKRNFEINTRDILKVVSHRNILKIKDQTKLNYNLEELSKENNLRGIFIREALKKLNDGCYSKEEVERAIEIGLDAM